MTILDISPTTKVTPGLAPGRSAELDQVVSRARGAADAFRDLDQAAVDRIVHAMVVAGLEHAVELALLAVEETGFGVIEDKVVKNYVATEFLYDYLRGKKSVGVIDEDAEAGLEWIAEPIGVVMAITPVTNPTSTVLFKAIVAAKTRNAILFRPSPRAVRCAERSAEILREAGEAAGLPPGAIQVIPDVAHEVTHHLFHHPGIDFIWTTGGTKIVALANSAGKPAISVGPGNAPVYLHRSADVPMAVVDILISKTFDASVICPAEQTCVVDAEIYDTVVAEFERMGAKVLAPDEVERLSAFVFGCDNVVNLEALGQPAAVLAHRAGIDVDDEVKVLIAPLPSELGDLAAHPLVHEKLMPVLGLVKAESLEHAVDACVLVTESGGLGHTSAVYARDEAAVEAFSTAVRTGRILVNAPTAVGALGGVYNNLTPTFSLGCGTWGGSLTTENVNYRQLLNIKVVSRRRTPPQWFRVRGDVFVNPGALDQLRELCAAQVVIVTDGALDARGVTEEVRRHLDGSRNIRVFADVPIEPDEAVIASGVDFLGRVQPDAIVAVGGGSVLDAAKVMRLLYEHPECSLHDLSLPFLDARKRVAVYPQDPHRVKLVAIPTTAGTGSEVSPAAVVSSGGRKVTLVDYSLVPDIAIVDPNLTLTMPPSLTADTGIDALTHALEAGVSIFATPYTDAFCVQAARLIFEALPKAYADGSDLVARTAMANAATIAGLAFANAFVGVNHALAHAVGARFALSHGRVNGIFLPHVMRYNAALPTKFMPAPGYGAYVAPEKYATLGWVLFGGRDPDEQRRRLFAHVDELLATVGIPRTLRDAGVDAKEFEAAIPDLLRTAFEDPSIRTNPRMPMLKELEALLRAAYGS
ncbi:MAG TPA: bifunctional acetaldehyde-CoA/alcohol dehydrogenase [Ilumatobacteraceae bacterium]|nr:bifunctional acetaldehyde-CoA/alcohol dehydrogenase [Ilumatobacteraceae bacterium]